MPDNTGKEKDSVGVARVTIVGKPATELSNGEPFNSWEGPELQVGDLVAYIPFTDAVLMDGFEKLSVIGYKNIMAVAQAPVDLATAALGGKGHKVGTAATEAKS